MRAEWPTTGVGGYMLMKGDHLVVPPDTAVPARLPPSSSSLHLKYFTLKLRMIKTLTLTYHTKDNDNTQHNELHHVSNLWQSSPCCPHDNNI